MENPSSLINTLNGMMYDGPGRAAKAFWTGCTARLELLLLTAVVRSAAVRSTVWR